MPSRYTIESAEYDPIKKELKVCVKITDVIMPEAVKARLRRVLGWLMFLASLMAATPTRAEQIALSGDDFGAA